MKGSYPVPPPCKCCGRVARPAFHFCNLDCRLEWLVTLSLWPTWAPALIGLA